MSPFDALDAARYREIFDRVQDIIYVRDMDGVIVDINAAAARFFGTPKDEIIGRTLHRHVDDDQALSLRATNELLVREGVDRSTVELRNSAGETRVLESTTTLIRDDQGLPLGACGVMRDVTEIVADNARKTRELEEARLVHQSLLPRDVPHLPHLELAVHLRPATEVGGDYYDFSVGDDGALTIALGDATGHGLKAGIFGATAKSYFQTLAPRAAPRDILETMSAAFRNLGIPSIYMCFMLVQIRARQASIVGAGMPPFFVRRRGGEIERVAVAGTPLGVKGRPDFDGCILDLDPGTTMLLFSDGLPDLVGPDDRELGYEAIESCLAGCGDEAENVLSSVVGLAHDWSSGRAAADDVMVMVVRSV